MRGPQALYFLRRTTTLAQHLCPLAPLIVTPRMEFSSFLEENPSDVVYTHNRKIDELIKSGNLVSAHEVFDGMSVRDVVTYNLLISGYSRNGCSLRAIEIYAEMVSCGLRESASTFPSVLSVCSDEWFCREGIQVHCRVISLGFGCNMFVRSALVGLYASFWLFDVALKLFDEMPERNLAVCNLLLKCFCETGESKQLFGVYCRMELEGVAKNGLTYCYLLRGCSNDQLLYVGKQLHSLVIKSGLDISNIFVANALVDYYSACGDLSGSIKSFNAVPEKDVISWNSIVSVCADCGSMLDSLGLFSKMQFWGKRPSIRSFMSFLNFCSRNSDIQSGKQIHCYVLKMGFDVSSLLVQSSLIDMYGKCNEIESSVLAYQSLPCLTLECCNSLMTSLVHCGITKDIIEMFGLMVDEGTGIDEVTLSTVLKALSLSLPESLHSCTLVHCCAIKSGYAADVAVSCSLIDAYSKSGQNEVSRKVFDELDSPNIFCLTSIINGYARNGMGRDCVEMLREMDQKNLIPDEVTILSVLLGCSHSGLVEEGELIFDSLELKYGISPGRKLYACMVDLLGRAGLVEKAERLLLQAHGDADCIAWSSLLQSCRIHRNERIGRRAAEVLMDLEPENFAVYIQVSKFYFEIGDFEISRQIREIAASRELMREIGYTRPHDCHSTETTQEEYEIFYLPASGKMVYTDLDILEELENFDVLLDDDETKLFDLPSFTSRHSGKNLVNVDTFGAAGDGVSDDTQAFISAWSKACGTSKSVFLVPEGRRYLVNATKFNGPCEQKLIIQIDGTIVAPDEPSNWDSKFQRIWLEFSKLKGVVFQGKGVIDGSGSKWWAASCKKNKSNPCKSAPTALTIESSSGVKVSGLTIQNSQQMNFIIARSDSVRVSKVMVSSPGDSPNTDGIHITGSTNVILQDCKIGTGDDCVSIVNASSNIKMKNIYCGPGHGISIGSLGKDNTTGIVTQVVLDTALLRETTNGLRIKTYQGGSGYVQGIRFTNVEMQDVANPILIDQFYCDSPTTCQNQTSAVKISQIMYRNITGTTKSEKAIKFACSDTVPCSHIVLNNVNLEGKDGQVEAYCNSAEGFGYGVIHPSADCLYSHDDKGLNQICKSEEAETGHDEL
ncbi:Pentatricopeptide repeat [Arabidopsis thaliana x Arabidopsis arenosa]|uniref:endo-polygalacturonase n=1 Tax=Arabidopsis thaliana x Arabidopsis arenosa TaxID=1240361 RepID=A0A8T2C6M1_9BRAS|nr:Pentatricopeptide repeat [Arabidopsis thaliana x Arabidopsis arenosa]